jgi:23S rRNA (uracil1939-C5)-methyltransferase
VAQLDKMLLDPPRSGAYAVVQTLHKPYLLCRNVL